MIIQWCLKFYSLSVRNAERHIYLVYLLMSTMEVHVIQFNAWLFMELYKWWWSPIIHIDLHNLKWCSINWIMELHIWIREPHNFGVLSPSTLHVIQQNINITLSCKKHLPTTFFLPLFSICTCQIQSWLLHYFCIPFTCLCTDTIVVIGHRWLQSCMINAVYVASICICSKICWKYLFIIEYHKDFEVYQYIYK